MYGRLIERILSTRTDLFNTTHVYTKWVSDGLRDLIPNWIDIKSPAPVLTPVLINAPTGSGKSRFILDELATFALKYDSYVCVLTNRSVLSWQMKAQLIEKKLGRQLSLRTVDDILTIGNVIIMTYQSFRTNKTRIPANTRFVVFDEVHFFFSDVAFNSQTSIIFKEILDCFLLAQRIYLSATPQNVKLIIMDEEKQLEERLIQTRTYVMNAPGFKAEDQIRAYYHPAKLSGAINEYVFLSDFSYIKLHFFDDWDSITDRIKKSPKSHKWMVFTETKSSGKELHSEFKNCSVYIDSENKAKANTGFILNKKFAQKILIATSVLDNGVSFEDDDLHDIVIDSADETQIKQMLGRKRRSDGENVNVYIKNKSREDIEEYRNNSEKMLSTVLAFLNGPSYFWMHRWGTLSAEEQGLFTVGTTVDYVTHITVPLAINEYAEYYFSCKSADYSRILTGFDMYGNTAFALDVCRWLEVDYTSKMFMKSVSLAKVWKEIYKETMNYYRMNTFTEDTLVQLRDSLIRIIQPIRKKMDVKLYKDADHLKADVNNILAFFPLKSDKFLEYHVKKEGGLFSIVEGLEAKHKKKKAT